VITFQGVFSRVEKPSDDINSRLFFMNKKEGGNILIQEYRPDDFNEGHRVPGPKRWKNIRFQGPQTGYYPVLLLRINITAQLLININF
jgi:hypothetical protein